MVKLGEYRLAHPVQQDPSESVAMEVVDAEAALRQLPMTETPDEELVTFASEEVDAVQAFCDETGRKVLPLLINDAHHWTVDIRYILSNSIEVITFNICFKEKGTNCIRTVF